MAANGIEGVEDKHAWERPGAHEVGPGVHRIPLPLPNDGLRAVNVYAVSDGDGLVMIDGGWAMADATQHLERALAEIGRRLADVREFLVTHLHRDHYTQAIAVRRITRSGVAVGAGERASLEAIRTQTAYPDANRLRQAGAAGIAELTAEWGHHRDLTDWEHPDRWLADGVDIALDTRTLRVIATPGHTRGHVVFHDRAADVLFAGDHVLPHITPSIGVELMRPKSPLRDYLASLQLIRRMPDARLLPAHGPVARSTHHRIEELLEHHEQRLTETAEAVAAGASTGFEVAHRLGWTRHLRRLEDLDLFNKVLAINETMAHLEVLVERGWMVRTSEDGVVVFRVA